jgi:outer membrane receptor protein involved in Fe transport
MASYEHNDGVIPVSLSQRGAVDQPADFTASTLTLVSEIPADNGQWSFRASGFKEEKGAGTLGASSAAQGADISGARKLEGDWGQARLILFAQTRDFANQTVSVATDRASVTPALDQYKTPASALGGSLIYAPAFPRWSPRWTLDWRHSEGETRELFRFVGNGFTRTRIAGGHQDLIGLGLDVPRLWQSDDEQTGLDATLRLDRWANSRAKRLEADRATGAVTLSETPVDREGHLATGRVSLFALGGQVRLSLFRTFRPPSLNELHRPFRVGNDVTEANADLVPEVLDGLDLDLKRQWQGLGGAWKGNLTLYTSKLQDPITNVTIGAGPGVLPRVGFLPAGGTLRQRLNAGEIRAKGLEGSLTWTPVGTGPRPEVALRLSMVDANVDGGRLLPALSGLRPAQSAPWASYLGVTLPFGAGHQLTVALRGEAARFEDDLNTRRLKAYQALDLRASWAFRRDVDIFVAGENVTGTAIATAISGAGIVSETSAPLWRIGFTVTR